MRALTKILLIALLLPGSAYVYARPHNAVAVDMSKIEDRHLTGFHAVDVGGSFDVYITQGSSESVKVEAPDEIISHIITEVDNGVLRIYNKNDRNFHWGDVFGNHKKIVVYVAAKDLNAIAVSGSGDVYFKEGIRTESLRLRVSGSGDMYGRVEVKNLESGVSGSGDVKLAGRAENSAVSVSGSGDFEARGLVTVNTIVRVSGSGDASINASNSVSASVSGSGDVRYSGGAKSVSSSKSGSGDVSRD
ncbi:MAG TPA: head GIN domain-containing protein [Mucilaginibacter sp.]|nr:head GIN domain-containing protein [Mucilaginibacter sp.]